MPDLDIDAFEWAEARNEVLIDWNDGHKSALPGHVLRNGCPCAHCLKTRDTNEAPKTASGAAAKIRFIDAVGLYAVNIGFDDNHCSGIFTYERLRSFCFCKDCLAV